VNEQSTARPETIIMEAFVISLSTVALAEIGDRTQLLTLVLVAQYRRPWQIIAGIFLATLANHFAAGLMGVWFGKYLSPPALDAVVGASMLAMAAWTLMPDKFDEELAWVTGRLSSPPSLHSLSLKLETKPRSPRSRSRRVIPIWAPWWLGPLWACWSQMYRLCLRAMCLPKDCQCARFIASCRASFFALGTVFIARATWRWIAA
jgi:putative Ca2+/H+ antiporter (TMEM165/GDT1 family)